MTARMTSRSRTRTRWPLAKKMVCRLTMAVLTSSEQTTIDDNVSHLDMANEYNTRKLRETTFIT